MATMMAGHIDPEKDAKYPIVLSDALMGRGTKELVTGIRYNHKPTESSDSSLTDARLKPSADADTYDLSFVDSSGKYEYQGTRNSSDGKYVLIFDPAKKHFVLHQVDSSFDMNLTGVPWAQDAASLRDTYEQLQPSGKLRRKSSSAQRTRATKETAVKETINETKRRKVEKAKKPPPPPREPTPDAEDEESDDGFTIEYPDGQPPPRFGLHSSPVPQKTAQEPNEHSDVDAEFEEDDDDEPNNDIEILELPSPVTNVAPGENEEEDEDLDLEAALEQAFETETVEKSEESSESEEE